VITRDAKQELPAHRVIGYDELLEDELLQVDELHELELTESVDEQLELLPVELTAESARHRGLSAHLLLDIRARPDAMPS